MFKKKILQVKIDMKKAIKGQKDEIFSVVLCRPKNMPNDEFEDIRRRINNILDDIKKYL